MGKSKVYAEIGDRVKCLKHNKQIAIVLDVQNFSGQVRYTCFNLNRGPFSVFPKDVEVDGRYEGADELVTQLRKDAETNSAR